MIPELYLQMYQKNKKKTCFSRNAIISKPMNFLMTKFNSIILNQVHTLYEISKSVSIEPFKERYYRVESGRAGCCRVGTVRHGYILHGLKGTFFIYISNTEKTESLRDIALF